jgi:potassium efflux system protein
MQEHYSALAERQRVALQKALQTEETRATQSVDPVEKRRARRTAQLLDLESQVVGYEKAYATAGTVSLQEQNTLADKATTDYAGLKKLVDDGSISPLDASRLKNDFRRIVPERAQIVRTDLAKSDLELTTYENALNDAEIDLVNDSRDDQFDRESLLGSIPAGRRAEAKAMLDELEARHRGLLNRRRDILRKLATRAEDTNKYVLKRIEMLDQQYAFIRTHIFWIRDAEPLGLSTLAHARDDSIRLANALVAMTLETGDRTLWRRTSLDFLLTLIGLILLPVPLWLSQRALDRFRLAATPAPANALSLADYPSEGIGG